MERSAEGMSFRGHLPDFVPGKTTDDASSKATKMMESSPERTGGSAKVLSRQDYEGNGPVGRTSSKTGIFLKEKRTSGKGSENSGGKLCTR